MMHLCQLTAPVKRLPFMPHNAYPSWNAMPHQPTLRSMLRCAVLCCTVLCSTLPCCAVPCCTYCALLCYAALCYGMPCYETHVILSTPSCAVPTLDNRGSHALRATCVYRLTTSLSLAASAWSKLAGWSTGLICAAPSLTDGPVSTSKCFRERRKLACKQNHGVHTMGHKG